MSQNSQGSGGTPTLAKALTLPHAPRAPPQPAEDNASGRLLRAIYREPGKVWARVFREARLRAGAARGTAGRGHRCRGNTAHGESGPAGECAGSRQPHRARRWRNLFQGVSEGSHSGPVAAPGAKLTHMSLKADADVMKRLPHHLTLTSMSYSTRGARPRAERRRRRMLRYGTHGGQRGR